MIALQGTSSAVHIPSGRELQAATKAPWYPLPAGAPPYNSVPAGQLTKAVNKHRASLGLGLLVNNLALRKRARFKSMHMAWGDPVLGIDPYQEHDDPPKGSPPVPPVKRLWADGMAAAGWPVFRRGCGENIAYGFESAATAMAAWLSDEGHKANIENPSWTCMGVGVAILKANTFPQINHDLIWWTNDFGA